MAFPRPASIVPLLVAAALALSGCFGSGGPSGAEVGDGRATIDLEVVDAATGLGVPGADVEVRVAGVVVARGTTDAAGRVQPTISPTDACSLRIERSGYTVAAASLDCRLDQKVRIPLNPLSSSGASPSGTVSNAPVPAPSHPAPGQFRLAGTLTEVTTGLPVGNVLLRLDPPDGATTRSQADGAFAFNVLPGRHTLQADADCLLASTFEVDVSEDTTLDLFLERDTPPTAPPAGIRATSGPGPGMVTVSWQDVPGAVGFNLLRNGQPFHRLGHSLAYGVPGATAGDAFAVSALDACGLASAASPAVSAAPLPGPAPMVLQPRPLQADVREEERPAFAADGTPLAARGWRTVQGTGNCCENYLTTTPSGRILDQGGSNLAFSDDEGQSWSFVLSPLILLAGEGSVTPAPDGDIVAFDWATYNADTSFAYRYSAATQTWHSQPVLFERPVYDRPWISVIKGPFTFGDMVVPYVSVVEGGTGVKDPLLISLDGLTYLPSNSITTAGGAAIDLRNVAFAPDANRDWLGPMSEFGVVPIENGLGLLEREGAMQGSTTWRPVTLPALTGDILRVDGAGTWHTAAVDGGHLTYAVSHDAGSTWETVGYDLPSGWTVGEWDFRANAAQDQAVFALNADIPGGKVQQAAVRFRGLDGVPTAQELLFVGGGDGAFGSGVAASGNRFDFMTLGFLPDGRIVMSGGDARASAPFAAIELPR